MLQVECLSALQVACWHRWTKYASCLATPFFGQVSVIRWCRRRLLAKLSNKLIAEEISHAVMGKMSEKNVRHKKNTISWYGCKVRNDNFIATKMYIDNMASNVQVPKLYANTNLRSHTLYLDPYTEKCIVHFTMYAAFLVDNVKVQV